MARKKTTEKSVEDTEKTEAKKTTKKAKQPKMIPITFKPQFSAATHKTVNLKTPKETLVGGQIRIEYEPQIEGLPLEFTIEKDEVKEVTLEQFKALYERGEIDTPEDIQERERKRLMLSNQAGANPREFVVAKNRAELYQDGFVLADPESIDLTRIKE